MNTDRWRWCGASKKLQFCFPDVVDNHNFYVSVKLLYETILRKPRLKYNQSAELQMKMKKNCSEETLSKITIQEPETALPIAVFHFYLIQ